MLLVLGKRLLPFILAFTLGSVLAYTFMPKAIGFVEPAGPMTAISPKSKSDDGRQCLPDADYYAKKEKSVETQIKKLELEKHQLNKWLERNLAADPDLFSYKGYKLKSIEARLQSLYARQVADIDNALYRQVCLD